MSDDKLLNLIKSFPRYSRVFEEVYNYLITHPKQKFVSAETFYTKKFSFTPEEITTALIILKETSIIKSTYCILEENGTKIGKNYNNLDEIPKYVDTMQGERKGIEDVFVVPYYYLEE